MLVSDKFLSRSLMVVPSVSSSENLKHIEFSGGVILYDMLMHGFHLVKLLDKLVKPLIGPEGNPEREKFQKTPSKILFKRAKTKFG